MGVRQRRCRRRYRGSDPRQQRYGRAEDADRSRQRDRPRREPRTGYHGGSGRQDRFAGLVKLAAAAARPALVRFTLHPGLGKFRCPERSRRRTQRMLPPQVLFLGSYPPRECGIATFTKDVVNAYDRAFGFSSPVIAIDEPDAEVRRYPPEVVARIKEQSRESYARAAELVSVYPIELVNIQHEYGLFGGERGEWLVDFIRVLQKPSRLDDAHRAAGSGRRLSASDASALRTASKGRRALGDRTRAVGKRLRRRSRAARRHPSRRTRRAVPGSPTPRKPRSASASVPSSRPSASSAAAKGLEYAIEAMRDVVKRHPEALYLILGETHPVVRRHEGESYRESLIAMVRDYGLQLQRATDRQIPRLRRGRQLSRGDRHLPHAVPQSRADRQRNAGVCRRLRQGDRLDALPLRARAARAQSRFSLRIPRRSLDCEPAEHAARRSRRCGARPNAAPTASDGR